MKFRKIVDFYEALRAPFPHSEVKWRVGSTTADKTRGQALAYIDARSVYDRLDYVCSYYGWQCNYSHASGKEDKTICNLGLYLPIGNPDDDIEKASWEWIWRADGAGDTDFEGEKGAISDALKRAAVRFGVARYLYSLPAPWVRLVAKGRSTVIEESELPRLYKELEGAHVRTFSSNFNKEDVERSRIEKEKSPDIIGLVSGFSSEEEIKEFLSKNKSSLEKLPDAAKKLISEAVKKKIKELKNDQ